ncbi:MAG: hypothetical protein ACRDPE_00195 [Solirubrobacterales bacterium]
MEAGRANWTDSRLDDLNDRVKSMDMKMDAGFARLDSRIDETNSRIDQMNHTMLQGMIALISIITVLLSILVGIVATKLFF